MAKGGKLHIDQFSVKVQRDGHTHSALVYVYENGEKLNEAARIYNEKNGFPVDDEPVRALCHSFSVIRYDEDGGFTIKSRTNIIRIPKDAGMAITGHELLHAACNMYRVFGAYHDKDGEFEDINLGDGNNDDLVGEEYLAHLWSDLAYDFGRKMIARGHW